MFLPKHFCFYVLQVHNLHGDLDGIQKEVRLWSDDNHVVLGYRDPILSVFAHST